MWVGTYALGEKAKCINMSGLKNMFSPYFLDKTGVKKTYKDVDLRLLFLSLNVWVLDICL